MSESKKEATMRKALEQSGVLKSEEQKKRDKLKAKELARKQDYEQKQKTLEYKRERLEWQKERSKKKDKERRELEKRRRDRSLGQSIGTQVISDKDQDPTSYKKALGSLASFAGGVARAGLSLAKRGIDKRKEDQRNREEEEIQAKQKRIQDAGEKGAEKMKKKTDKALSQSTKLLQPAPKQMSGREKKTAIAQGKYLGKGRISEKYYCWKEDFFYNLGESRKKYDKEGKYENKPVDVMKGKNKITIGPNIKESSLYERKRDHLANALLGVAFATNAIQSPKDFIRSGHIEGPGIQLMSRMMSKRKEANRNLDSGRVSHPARNIKKRKVKEDLDLYKEILIDLFESKYSKSNLKCNSPKSDPVGSGETGKSHVVKACSGGTEKLIRFGQRGVKGSPKKEGESEEYANRRKRFKARHSKNIAKGKMSAAYWANKSKW